MHEYEDSKIKHSGRSPHRLKSNPKERVFLESWQKEQKQNHELQWLLCASYDQNVQERDITQEEATCAATLMQWLGSPVGSCWLDETLAKCKEVTK